MRDLLARTRGIDGLLAEIDFTGLAEGQALDELFPRVATVATDGYGNGWVVDLLRENGGWGPIWFLSHDPPVALHQCNGLATFLDEKLGADAHAAAYEPDRRRPRRQALPGRPHPAGLARRVEDVAAWVRLPGAGSASGARLGWA